MDIQIQAGRDLVNQWVDVSINGGVDQLIASVTTVLDGFSIGDDNICPPETSYKKTWNQVGTGAPNQPHEVVVTAVDDKGNRTSTSKTWRD